MGTNSGNLRIIKLTPKQAEVYQLIHNNPDITQKDIMKFFTITRSTLKDHLGVLDNNNILKIKLINSRGTKSYRVNKRIKVCV